MKGIRDSNQPSAWKADILAITLMPLLNDFRILHYLLTNLKNIKYYPSISKAHRQK